ncbi:hypothetical protein AMTR_s00013p00236760, partial [Amborella trichopoda]
KKMAPGSRPLLPPQAMTKGNRLCCPSAPFFLLPPPPLSTRHLPVPTSQPPPIGPPPIYLTYVHLLKPHSLGCTSNPHSFANLGGAPKRPPPRSPLSLHHPPAALSALILLASSCFALFLPRNLLSVWMGLWSTLFVLAETIYGVSRYGLNLLKRPRTVLHMFL